jgi:hypothetical protein
VEIRDMFEAFGADENDRMPRSGVDFFFLNDNELRDMNIISLSACQKYLAHWWKLYSFF